MPVSCMNYMTDVSVLVEKDLGFGFTKAKRKVLSDVLSKHKLLDALAIILKYLQPPSSASSFLRHELLEKDVIWQHYAHFSTPFKMIKCVLIKMRVNVM